MNFVNRFAECNTEISDRDTLMNRVMLFVVF